MYGIRGAGGCDGECSLCIFGNCDGDCTEMDDTMPIHESSNIELITDEELLF